MKSSASCWQRQRGRLAAGSIHRRSLLDTLFIIAALTIGILMGYERQLLSPATTPDDPNQMMTSTISTPERELPPNVPIQLLGELAKQQAKLNQKLQSDYAEYTTLLFNKLVTNDLFILEPDSRKRLSRRIMSKIVQAATTTQSQPVTFTWVTAGDSSAAGYGNLPEQSYTSVLEDTLMEPFKALGLTFVVKNRAVGGLGGMAGGGGGASVTEVASCFESIYGSDVDVLSWDLSSSSSSLDEHEGAMGMNLWLNRAASHPTKPILFLLLEERSSNQWNQFHRLETKGIGVGLLSKGAYTSLKQSRIPDTNDRSTQIDNEADPNVLPLALRYFLCNGATEGVTTCSEEANNDERTIVCPEKDGLLCRDHKWDRKGQCNDTTTRNEYQELWHLGWKEHLLIGRLLGNFLFQSLTEAVFDLKTLVSSMSVDRTAATSTPIKGQVARELINILDQDNDRDAFLFKTTRIDTLEDGWGSLVVADKHKGDTLIDNVRQKLFRRTKAMCWTSLLPSEAHANSLVERYESKYHNMNGTSSLQSLSSINQLNEENCPITEEDRRPLFLVRNEDGDVQIQIPHELEQEYFKIAERWDESHHLLILCFHVCVENLCVPPMQSFHGPLSKNIEIKVDEEIVNGSVEMERCHILKSADQGFLWSTSTSRNTQGHSLTFRVNQPNSLIEITSIIII